MIRLRQLRGELRRLAHPAVLGAVVFVAVVACASQAQANGADPRPPSPIDWTGSMRIAAQHHASALGFALLGIAAGFTSGEDARTGALAAARLADHSVRGLWLRRVLALLLLASASGAITTVAVRTTRSLTACTAVCAPESRSSITSTLADVAAAGLALVFIAALATALALALRSEVLTAVAAVAIFLVPSNHVGDQLSWITPTRWIALAVQLDTYGVGSDYIGGKSAYAHRGRPAVVGAGLLTVGSLGLALVGARLIRRRSAEGERG